MAAAASLEDRAKELVAAVEEVMKDEGKEPAKLQNLLAPLAPIPGTLKQLSESKSSSAANVKSQLETAISKLITWANDTLCSRADGAKILEHVAKEIDKVIPIQESSTNEEVSVLYPHAVPRLPEQVTQQFLLWCFSADDSKKILIWT